ncbi:MAG: hypothetical protein H0U27_02450 [Nitrosopumilus sp.]|nr:hypothetical protein [Nitrosopumilus sp.]
MNESKIIKYAKKNKLDETNILTITDTTYLKTLALIDMTYPEIMVFDKEGKYIKYKDDKACNASAFKFIDSLRISNNYSTIATINLNSLQNNFRDLNGNTINIIDKNSDFTLLLFWTEWTGKLNKDHTLIWENKAKNNINCKISLYKINCDFQEYWNSQEREKIINHLSGKK